MRAASETPDGRAYPARPIVGVGAIIFNGTGEVLLVRRGQEPLAGLWTVPGGGLETGETLAAGTAREVLEETGLVVEVGPLAGVFERILLDEQRNVRYHFILVDYLCRPLSGSVAARSDVSACAWVPLDRLGDFALAGNTGDAIAAAETVRKTRGW